MELNYQDGWIQDRAPSPGPHKKREISLRKPISLLSYRKSRFDRDPAFIIYPQSGLKAVAVTLGLDCCPRIADLSGISVDL